MNDVHPGLFSAGDLARNTTKYTNGPEVLKEDGRQRASKKLQLSSPDDLSTEEHIRKILETSKSGRKLSTWEPHDWGC